MFYFLFDKFQLQQQDSILNTAFYQLVILLLLLQPGNSFAQRIALHL